MFVGHGLLAFALVASLCHARGAGRDRALGVGLLAAGFATVPDLDVLHPIVALLLAPVEPGATPEAFWALSTEVHRTATHSLVVGGITAVGVTAWAAGRGAAGSVRPAGRRWLVAACGLATLTGLAALVWTVAGAAAGGVVGAMALAGLALALAAARYGLGARAVGVASLLGLWTHPFGDLLTGQPPPLLYPLPVDLPLARVTLSADPTVHLLGAFLVELGTVWLALLVLARLSEVRVRPHLGYRSLAGLGYAGAALVLPAPSLDAASGFVFSVLAVGLVGVPVGRGRDGGVAWGAATTALAAVSLATVAYGVAYVGL